MSITYPSLTTTMIMMMIKLIMINIFIIIDNYVKYILKAYS